MLTREGLLAQQVGHLLQELLGGTEVINLGLVGLLNNHNEVVDGIEVVLVPTNENTSEFQCQYSEYATLESVHGLE